MKDSPRLIEVAFPLKQASLDSVHEKNVRHGHISTLHIWPARRPLAACRAALIATLLPDPGNAAERKEMLEKLGGRVKEVTERKREGGRIVERVKEVTEGGILHWGRESGPDLEWFRQKIREAYGGRAPKVLDPFAGGGAIPLEAMRLGCEATAMDINPVAWFILKCTLEYPQKLAGQTRPLPDFVLKDRKFMEAFFKAQGFKGASLKAQLAKLGLEKAPVRRLEGMELEADLSADLAWQVRAWGWWVLQHAKRELAPFYPMVDGKPTVAYLWARTVKCKNCRATVPLLKTRWLCKKDNKRVRLTMEPNAEKTGVVFGIEKEVPQGEGGPAARREHDRKLGAGTMSRAGAKCPCCEGIMTMEDIRLEGQAGRLGAVMTAVVVDTPKDQKKRRARGEAAIFDTEEGDTGKDYRLPHDEEIRMALKAEKYLEEVYSNIPNGKLYEPIDPASTRSISCQLYGIDNFQKAFLPRQQVTLGVFINISKSAINELDSYRYSVEFQRAIFDYLSIAVDRIADRSSVFCRWDVGKTIITNTYSRFALSMLWDFCETNPISDVTGSYTGAINWIGDAIHHFLNAEKDAPFSKVSYHSAIDIPSDQYDLILTDPPYYQAISYADLSDFFYIWQKRIHADQEWDNPFTNFLSPKESEIVQHIRPDKDRIV